MAALGAFGTDFYDSYIYLLHTIRINQHLLSGCFKILAELIGHEDIRVSVPASRALINCDIDKIEPNHRFYRNLYVIHPLHRTQQSSRKVDVVFIHGLLGSLFVTWRQRDISNQEFRENLYLSQFVDVPDVPLDCDTSILR